MIQPKLIRIDTSGKTTRITGGEKNGPWNGVDYPNDHFYIAEGGHLEGGHIKVTSRGEITALVKNLPARVTITPTGLLPGTVIFTLVRARQPIQGLLAAIMQSLDGLKEMSNSMISLVKNLLPNLPYKDWLPLFSSRRVSTNVPWKAFHRRQHFGRRGMRPC